MASPNADAAFSGSVPQLYERYLVPLIFEQYADDIAARVAQCKPSRVLEIAAGTGVVTRRMAKRLPADTAIMATDLNPAMLEQAQAVGTSRPVTWQPADAMQLPFPDESFDAVVCQFGVMFFPDKIKAYAEVKRVLRPGGHFVFSVWDKIEENPFAEIVTQALATLFPDDPPRFLARTPHGYYDPTVIADDLARGGFTQPPAWEGKATRSRADTPRIPAMAFCEGTPLRGEIEARGPGRLSDATGIAADAIERRFGTGPVESGIRALVFTVGR